MNYNLISFITAIIIAILTCLSIWYRIRWKESQLRENLKNTNIKELKLNNSTYYLQALDSLKIYQILIDLLLTQPLVYSKGLMRKSYEVKSNGTITTRVKINKINEPAKWANNNTELYYIWSNDSYISKTNLIEALGFKDTKKIIEHINSVIITLKELKSEEDNKLHKNKKI